MNKTITAGAINAPPMLLAFTELQHALFEFATLPVATPLLGMAPKGDGHPVLVLPGFTASDRSTAVLRQYLDTLGYTTFTWDLGRNLGPRSVGREGQHLQARLRAIHDQSGQKISLVGWSLGGVMARRLARHTPEAVRRVISLGSPFTGNPRATNVWRLYEGLSGERLDDEAALRRLREDEAALPVPATAIYSRSDGIVAWQNCMEPDGEATENIEVYGSHCGLPYNPAVLFAVADRLALRESEWVPFDRSGWRSVFYPAVKSSC